MKTNADKKTIQIILDFVEGRISVENFWEKYKNIKSIREVLIYDKYRPMGIYLWDNENKTISYFKNKPADLNHLYNPENLSEKFNINEFEARVELFKIVKRFLERRKIKFSPKNKDYELSEFLSEIQPEWLVIREEEFLFNIVNSAPKSYNKTKKTQWCKAKIIELFKYDNMPPKWIQNPEWPIVDDKPLVFCRQETDAKNSSHEIYYFYHPETKVETVVEQYD